MDGNLQLERPSVTVDVALLTASRYQLWALLTSRSAEPWEGSWALPGDFVRIDESLDQAAARVLAEKAGVEGVFLEQLYTFGDPTRDPRTRVISVSYYALVDAHRLSAMLQGRALARLRVPWRGETGGPVDALDEKGEARDLAFDHGQILGMAVKRIRGKLNYAPVGYQLLAPEFTLRQLQQVHETVLGERLNKDSFRRRMLATGELEATGAWESEVGHRPAELYRFVNRTAI